MVVVVFGVLVSQDATIPKVKVAGENGANAELCGKADDREGGRFDSNFAFALAFPATPKSKAFGPTKIFGIVEGNEVDFSVVGQRGWGGVRVGVHV